VVSALSRIFPEMLVFCAKQNDERKRKTGRRNFIGGN
jgi:hypothetical protein